MANKTITMLQLRRVLQLKEKGLSNRQIKKHLNLSRKTVDEYVNRVKQTGKNYKDLLKLEDEALGLLLFQQPQNTVASEKYNDLQSRLPGYVNELTNSKATRIILWEEYRQQVPDGYSRSQFCEHLSRYLQSRKAVMHIEHEPAELMEFDFAGDSLHYIDLKTGEIVKCPVLVCRLACSGYTYVEALQTQQRPFLIAALNNALQYFGGVPHMVRTDNMAQIVKKANRYEPTFDEYAQQWSLHYNTTLTATRVARPRDKAGVESSVNTAYYRIYAPMRNKQFSSLQGLNTEIMVHLEKLNHSKYQGRDYSRYEKFITIEKPLLRPLPEDEFAVKYSRTAKVAPNYHVMLGEDRHFYSVPHQYLSKQVTLVYDCRNVEIYLQNQRIASYKRNYSTYGYTTLKEHMPANHKAIYEQKGWDEEHFLKKAEAVGKNTKEVIYILLKQRTFVEQTYRSCIGSLDLGKKYGNNRLEAACTRVLAFGSRISYSTLRNILEKNLDKEPFQVSIDFCMPLHDNIRGDTCYG